jgi:lipopolysaccharide transport system ATP-binding protein
LKPILEIQGISKKYSIQANKQPYLSLRENLFSFVKKNKKEEFWALNDITFDVMPGDTVGIIGKNGAGKSTLLKILSKITPPTKGKIISRGRIASLLEVGTGFHPELSGRENVFMNGSILGMRRTEISKNFDAIVEFAGVEKFIDTPLKHYSSGMQLRLAFAVAAFLENEILIIDEVLAVGDAEFQKKCLGKMGDISKSGRTILFVSHNMGTLNALCSRGVLLNNGETKLIGNIQDAILKYNYQYQTSFKEWTSKNEAPGDNIVKLKKIYVVNSLNIQVFELKIDEEFAVCVEFEILENNVKPAPNLHFYDASGTYCFAAISVSVEFNKGCYTSFTWIPGNFLNNQTYNVGVAFTTLKTSHIHFYEKETISIEIIENKMLRKHDYGGTIEGAIRPELKNNVIKIN